MNKAERVLKWMPRLIRKRKVRGSMAVVLLYGAGIMWLYLLFIIGWIINGVIQGKFDLPEITSFFSACTSAAALAAVGFVVVMNVDKNHDGRPDAAEIKAKKGQEDTSYERN